MRISVRNQLSGTVKTITHDQIMAEVVVTLDGGQEVVSIISAAAVQHLQLAPGAHVTVVIKSTEVMLATDA